MRSETRFDKLAGPRMSIEEFAGDTPSVYERLEAFRQVLSLSDSIGTVRKEFERIFKTEAR